MKWIKAITTDGKTVYFNTANVMTITPKENGSATILMGAGLYWNVEAESLVLVNLEDLPDEIAGV